MVHATLIFISFDGIYCQPFLESTRFFPESSSFLCMLFSAGRANGRKIFNEREQFERKIDCAKIAKIYSFLPSRLFDTTRIYLSGEKNVLTVFKFIAGACRVANNFGTIDIVDILHVRFSTMKSH